MSSATISGMSYHLALTATSLLSVLMTCSQLWGGLSDTISMFKLLLDKSHDSNKLYSYINTKWVEHFPPMRTRRRRPGAVYANNTPVVAGGWCDSNNLNTVEILNIANIRWSIVSSLPVPTTN